MEFERKRNGYLEKNRKSNEWCQTSGQEKYRRAYDGYVCGLNQTIDKMTKASGVRWLGHVLRKEDGDVGRNALDFNVGGRRKEGLLQQVVC